MFVLSNESNGNLKLLRYFPHLQIELIHNTKYVKL